MKKVILFITLVLSIYSFGSVYVETYKDGDTVYRMDTDRPFSGSISEVKYNFFDERMELFTKYLNGKKHGIAKLVDDEGNLLVKYIYDSGVLKEKRQIKSQEKWVYEKDMVTYYKNNKYINKKKLDPDTNKYVMHEGVEIFQVNDFPNNVIYTDLLFAVKFSAGKISDISFEKMIINRDTEDYNPIIEVTEKIKTDENYLFKIKRKHTHEQGHEKTYKHKIKLTLTKNKTRIKTNVITEYPSTRKKWHDQIVYSVYEGEYPKYYSFIDDYETNNLTEDGKLVKEANFLENRPYLSAEEWKAATAEQEVVRQKQIAKENEEKAKREEEAKKQEMIEDGVDVATEAISIIKSFF